MPTVRDAAPKRRKTRSHHSERPTPHGVFLYLRETKIWWCEGEGEEGEGGEEKVHLLTHATARGVGKNRLTFKLSYRGGIMAQSKVKEQFFSSGRFPLPHIHGGASLSIPHKVYPWTLTMCWVIKNIKNVDLKSAPRWSKIGGGGGLGSFGKVPKLAHFFSLVQHPLPRINHVYTSIKIDLPFPIAGHHLFVLFSMLFPRKLGQACTARNPHETGFIPPLDVEWMLSSPSPWPGLWHQSQPALEQSPIQVLCRTLLA